MIHIDAHLPINATMEEAIEILINQLPLADGRGRSTPQDRLKKLGASRLLAAAGDWQEALEYADEHKTENGFAPLYPSQEQWCRARSGAQDAVNSAMSRLF